MGTLVKTIGPAAASTGEKNYLAAATWTASDAGVTVVTTTTAADLPRAVTTATGIKITGVSGSTAYAYARFTLDAADYGKKLKLQFALNAVLGAATGYVSGDFKIDVYSNTLANYTGTSTRLSLTPTDGTSALSPLPNVESGYATTFDVPNATAPYIEVRIGLNSSNTHSIILSDIVVGPGILTQVPAVSGWTSYTPIWSSAGGTAPVVGNGTLSGQYRRVGDAMQISLSLNSGTTTTYGSGSPWTISVPSGFTINTSVMPSVAANSFADGKAVAYVTASALEYDGNLVVNGANNNLLIQSDAGAAATNWSSTVPNTWTAATASQGFSLRFTVPINEWAGSGTVNVVQNDVEYAYNTNTTDADDTTSFGYGPSGVAFGNFSSTRNKTVQFRTPIQGTDQLSFEFQKVGGPWTAVASGDGSTGLATIQFQNGVTYGAGLKLGTVSSTQVIVNFGTYSYPNGVTYGSAGAAWTSLSGYNWRVRKIAGGQAVGFSIVNPGVSAGLVSASGLPGNTTGNAISAEYVGQIIDSSANITTTACTSATLSAVGGSSLVLPKGVWQIVFSGWVYAADNNVSGQHNVDVRAAIYNLTDAVVVASSMVGGYYTAQQQGAYTSVSMLKVVNLSTTKTFNLQLQSLSTNFRVTLYANGATQAFAADDTTNNWYAVRIA